MPRNHRVTIGRPPAQALARTITSGLSIPSSVAYTPQGRTVTDRIGLADSRPVSAGTVTFVVGATPLSAGDANLRSELESMGYNVTNVLASAAEDATVRTLVVVSESVVSSDVAAKYRDRAIPAIVFEAFIWDDWDAAPTPPTFNAVATAGGYVASTHAANGGLTLGAYTFATGGDQFETPDTGLPAAATRTITDAATPTAVRGLAFESGAAMLNTRSAAARRLFLTWKETMWAAGLTANGRSLFRAHVSWAVGAAAKTIGINHDGVELQRASWPKYGMVYLNPWFKEYVADVKASNPDCLVGGYRCAGSFRPGASVTRLGRTTYASGWDRDPPNSWYINGTGADPAFQWRFFPGLYFADLEQAVVRDAWVSDTLAWATWGGFDAIFLDNATMRNVDTSATEATGYGFPAGWTQARYKDAMLSHLASLGPAMHNAGVRVFANLGSSTMSQADAGLHLGAGSNSGAAFRFGGSWEYWAQFDGEPDRYSAFWIGQAMAIADEAAARGLAFLPLASHVPQAATTTKRLARAMQLMTMAINKPNFLLIYNASTFYPPDNDFAVEIGQPTGARFAVGAGLRRNFTGGVCVMTHTDTGETFALGATYRDPSGSLVTSVTLAGRSGMALSVP